MTEVFDYVVAGAGSAGCALAARLAEDGRYSVCLVEAGGAGRSLWSRMPAGNGFLFGDRRHDWGFYSVPQSSLGGRRLYYPRGKGVGGSSLMNGMIYIRGAAGDYDRWRQKGLVGWSYAELLPYFRRSAQAAHRTGDPFHGDGPLRLTPAGNFDALNARFVAACCAAGAPANADFNGARQLGAGRIDTKVWRGRRQSSAAGNAVVIKPSEHASASTLELARVLQAADVLPAGLVNVVTGDGRTAGEALVAHRDVRMVSFTGGLAGGRAVAAAAAEQVKPCIMELGGKSPQIVLGDADLDQAARGIAAGVFPPAGQSCVAGARILVERGVMGEFTERLVAIAARANVGDPTDPTTQIGPIAHRGHYDHVLACIDAAEAAGHRVLLDGRTARRERGYFIGPTLFADVPGDARLAQEEIFGPVASLTAFDAEEDAVALANGTDYGLAAGVWSRDASRAMRLAAKIEAGTVYLNTYFDASPQSPVGGFKQSGYGRESGWEGMRAFLQTRSVWLDLEPDHADPFPAEPSQ